MKNAHGILQFGWRTINSTKFCISTAVIVLICFSTYGFAENINYDLVRSNMLVKADLIESGYCDDFFVIYGDVKEWIRPPLGVNRDAIIGEHMRNHINAVELKKQIDEFDESSIEGLFSCELYNSLAVAGAAKDILCPLSHANDHTKECEYFKCSISKNLRDKNIAIRTIRYLMENEKIIKEYSMPSTTLLDCQNFNNCSNSPSCKTAEIPNRDDQRELDKTNKDKTKNPPSLPLQFLDGGGGCSLILR